MTKAVKKSLVIELNEVIDDVLSLEFSKRLKMIDDFVWIENTPSDAYPFEEHSSSETNTHMVNVAQHDTETECSETDKECLPEHIENVIALPSEWEKEVLVDQQYWEQKWASAQRENSSRFKYPASQRLTVTELKKIAMHNTVKRDPAYFKFNINTTAILNTLIDKNIVGSYQNILGKGNSSVVIHADYPDSFYSRHGMAVKVYKLSSDAKKNNAILKRAKREYDHLSILKYCRTPTDLHRMKNVLVLTFFGINQEPLPCLSSLPSEHAGRVYEMIVEQIKRWYTEFSIVHGKLCAKNILHDTTVHPVCYDRFVSYPCGPYIVGWGHSVKGDHPRALMKLMRDCHFVTNFFGSRGVAVKSTKELFKHVTGLEQISNEVLDAMYKKDLWQAGQLTNPNRL